MGTLLAVRFVLAAALFWGLVLATGAARQPAHPAPAGHRLSPSGSAPSATARRPAPTSSRSSGSTRRCCPCCSTPSPRWSRSLRSRWGASSASRRKTGALVLASGGLVLVLAGAGAGALDPLGSAAGDHGRRRLHDLHPHLGRASPTRVGPLLLSALVCTGAATTLTIATAVVGRPAPGRRDRDRLRLAGGHRGHLDRGCRQPVLRRAQARRPDDRLDPLDGRAGDDGRAGLPGLRRVAEPRAARRRGAAWSAPCSSSARRPAGPRRRARRTRPPEERAMAGSLDGQGGARDGRDPGRRARHRRRAGRGGRDRLLHGPHARASTGPSTTGRRRSRRPPSSSTPPAAAGSPSRSTTCSPIGCAALVARIDDEQGRLDVLVNDVWGGEKLAEWDTPIWEHDLDGGLRHAAPGDRHASHHEPLRPAAADPPPRRPASSR